jgi:hypothetical protein
MDEQKRSLGKLILHYMYRWDQTGT